MSKYSDTVYMVYKYTPYEDDDNPDWGDYIHIKALCYDDEIAESIVKDNPDLTYLKITEGYLEEIRAGTIEGYSFKTYEEFYEYFSKEDYNINITLRVRGKSEESIREEMGDLFELIEGKYHNRMNRVKIEKAKW